MDIGWVKDQLNKGEKICRKGWNGKGMYLFLFSQSGFCTKETDDYTPEGELAAYNFELDDENENPMWHIGFVENENQDNEKFYPLKDFVLLKTAGDYCIPWNASQEDLQADDWELAI